MQFLNIQNTTKKRIFEQGTTCKKGPVKDISASRNTTSRDVFFCRYCDGSKEREVKEMGRRRKVQSPDLDYLIGGPLPRYVTVNTLCAKYQLSQKVCRQLAEAANAFREIRKTVLVDRDIFEQTYRDVLVENRLGKKIKTIIHDDTIKPVRKVYMRYEEAAEFYSMSLTCFKAFARDIGAVRRIGNIVLVNIDVVDAYLDKLF